MPRRRRTVLAAVALACLLTGCGGPQCAPYARHLTGVALVGDAGDWWGQAAGRYARTDRPELGAILVFRPTRRMPAGHVSVVRRVVDARTILVDHANWEPGRIDQAAPVRDVSRENDWSAVRVWWRAIGRLGTSVHPTYGFILPTRPDFPASRSDWVTGSDRQPPPISACMAGPGEPCASDDERTGPPAGGKRV